MGSGSWVTIGINVLVLVTIVGSVMVKVQMRVNERPSELLSLRFQFGNVSLFGLLDFIGGDVRVSLISPDGVGPQVLPGAVDVGLVRDVSHGSSSVVGSYLHHFLVNAVLDEGDFRPELLGLLEVWDELGDTLEGEGGTDFHHFLQFLAAALGTIDHLASLEIAEKSLACPRESLFDELDRRPSVPGVTGVV
jgi:hypothetical protein